MNRSVSVTHLSFLALLLGMAVTFLERSAPKSMKWSTAGTALIILFSVTTGSAEASRWHAIQERDALIVEFVADSIEADSVHFAVRSRGFLEWGDTMRDYAYAAKKDWPAPKDVVCDSTHLT